MTDDLKPAIKFLPAYHKVASCRKSGREMLQISFFGVTERAEEKGLNFYNNKKQINISIPMDELPHLLRSFRKTVREWAEAKRQEIDQVENSLSKD